MCGDTQIDAACNLRRVTQRMSECDPQTNLNEFEKQFKVKGKRSRLYWAEHFFKCVGTWEGFCKARRDYKEWGSS